MSAALGPEVHPQSSAFRIFRRELIDAGDGVSDPFLSIDVLLSWATTRVRVVEVDFAERASGTSAYGFRKLAGHAVNMITGYSTRPLRWVSLMGLACAIFGFALLAYVIVRWMLGGADVAGFTFLAAAITLFSGVQLVSLGVLGEYLGRMHFRSMGRPPYIVRRRTDEAEPPDASSAHAV
jgi:undecaprenyl-phosphate 4-deoxy-4-formamido-L-arabinose transferase